jgi:putative ABC transport system permease protein
MSTLLRLTAASLRNRRLTAALTMLSIALSVALLLGVERLREETRAGFAATVSGTDLIVGARSSPAHLMLSSVFHIGNPTNSIRPESHDWVATRPEVAWTIPLALGDSHRGYRVLGTTEAFFTHYRFGEGRGLVFSSGNAFTGERDAVLGAEVAARLGYRPGQRIVLAHGAGDVSFIEHDEQPFQVVGILRPTGTPVDRSVQVPLRGLALLHAAEQDEGDPLAAALHAGSGGDDTDTALTAALVGLKQRSAALGLQRTIGEYPGEPLTAVLPGPTLMEIWEIAGLAERALLGVSIMVVVVGLAGMLVALLTSLGERRREMAVLRAIGARPVHVFALILLEAVLLTLAGIVVGTVALQAGLHFGQDAILSTLGLPVAARWPSAHEGWLLLLVASAGTLIGLLPAWRIYRHSLADGMTPRL